MKTILFAAVLLLVSAMTNQSVAGVMEEFQEDMIKIMATPNLSMSEKRKQVEALKEDYQPKIQAEIARKMGYPSKKKNTTTALSPKTPGQSSDLTNKLQQLEEDLVKQYKMMLGNRKVEKENSHQLGNSKRALKTDTLLKMKEKTLVNKKLSQLQNTSKTKKNVVITLSDSVCKSKLPKFNAKNSTAKSILGLWVKGDRYDFVEYFEGGTYLVFDQNDYRSSDGFWVPNFQKLSYKIINGTQMKVLWGLLEIKVSETELKESSGLRGNKYRRPSCVDFAFYEEELKKIQPEILLANKEFYQAAEQGNIGDMNSFLLKGADINILYGSEKWKARSAVYKATFRSDIQTFKFLVKSGADTTKTISDITWKIDVKMLEEIINSGENIYFEDSSYLPKHWEYKRHKEQIIRIEKVFLREGGLNLRQRNKGLNYFLN